MLHNKKRNTALVYEFLIRHITKCLIENQSASANKAMALVKRYFRTGPLREELALFNCVTQAHAPDIHYAEKLLGAVVEKARSLDYRKLEHVKSRLIRDINETLDPAALYKSKVPYYSVYASLQTLINHSNGKQQKLDGIQRVQLEQRVVSFLTQERTPEKTLTESLKLDPQYNNTVYKLVIRKFDEKYKDTLNEAQKKLLTKYAIASMSDNKQVFSHALRCEINNVRKALGFIANKEIREDKELVRRVNDCRLQAEALNPDNLSEANLVKVLRLMTLAREVAA